MTLVRKGKIVRSAKAVTGYGRSIHGAAPSMGLRQKTKKLEKISKEREEMLTKRKEVLQRTLSFSTLK